MANTTQEDVPDDRYSALSERIEQLEGEFAASWAVRTRVEYEARMRGEMRNEVREFMIKFAIGATVILGGAGYMFIVSQTKATFHDEAAASNERIQKEMRTQFQNALDEQKKTQEWLMRHNLGVFYRYALEYQYGSKKGLSQVKAFEEILDKARGNFGQAFQKDPDQVSTLWELGNLYYFIPLNSGADHLVDTTRARRYFRDAVKLYPPELVQRGFRADAYHRLGTVTYAEFTTARDREQREEAAREALGYWEQARQDYLEAEINADWVQREIEDLDEHLLIDFSSESATELKCELLPEKMEEK